MANPFNYVTIRSKYGLLEAATPVIICGGAAVLAWAYWRRRQGRAKGHPVLKRSLSVGTLHGGQLALRRLVDYHEARADKTSLKDVEDQLKAMLAHNRPDFIKLQCLVGKLEMIGREGNTVKILEDELKNVHNRSHEAYEIEMLLVETLIYKGEFERALHCHCLYDEQLTDARRPLYKAIIQLLLDEPLSEELAKTSWEEFEQIRDHFEWPPNLQEIQHYQIIIDFDKFKNVVKLLKKDIHKAAKKKKKI